MNEEDINPEEGLEEIRKKREGEGTLDYRKRIYPDYKANRRKNQQRLGDDDIQAQGDAKLNPTGDMLAPKTPEEIAAAEKGIEEAKKNIRGKYVKRERDSDGFLKIVDEAFAPKRIRGSTSFDDEARFQEQLATIKKVVDTEDPTFISELLLDLKTGYSAAKSTPGGLVPKAVGAAGAIALRRIVDEALDLSINVFKKEPPIDVYAMSKNWRPNLKQFGYYPDTKDAISQFGEQTVNDFMERARLHRVKRARVGKKEIMKDFNETLEIIRPDGTVDLGMVVRRKGYKNKLDLTDSANYQVRTLSQVMEDVRVNTGWLTQQSDDVKAMQVVRSKLNQLKTKYSDDLVLAKLMEYGDEAYLEHMVGKAQYGWLWDIKEAKLKKGDTPKYPWIKAPERNHVDNLRLLVSKPYKKLKDTTETRIKPLNKLLPKNQRYIINIEDPMTNPYAKDNPLHKSNPGNILIQTAKPSDKAPKTIGIIGDYLQDFYGSDFMKKYNGNELLAVFENMSAADKKLYSLYQPKTTRGAGKRGSFKKVETAVQYRDRVLKERINLILKEKGKFNSQEIQTEVFNDLLNFYELFSAKANFVRRPKYVSDMMQKNAVRDIKFPFSKQKFDEFYSLKRKAEQDVATSINQYETGQATRMTKKAYNNLWKQLTEITAMDYNFKVDENDFTTRLYNIMNKYPE